MTQKAPADKVISEMIAALYPAADPSTVHEAAESVVTIGSMKREPTAADAEAFRLQFGEALAPAGPSTPGSVQPGVRSDRVKMVKEPGHLTAAAKEKLAADLKKKYDSGATIRALAEETGRSYGFVHRMLRESGVTLRGRGGSGLVSLQKETAEES
jgi:hypothetical protein